MPTTALLNVPLEMAEDVVYCTPVRAAQGFVAPPNAALEGSATTEAGDFDSITVTDGTFTTGAPFIRCTDAAGCTIQFKPLGA